MDPKLEAGAVIADRYQLERMLGQGGMGTVWQARHLITRRAVAMKFLHAALHGRPEMRRRFLREAQAAAAVEHPNVVTLHDVFQLESGSLVLVMARLEGETLAARLARDGALPVESALDLLLPVVSAVGSAHARGVIHRDLKPDNIFLSSESGQTVVRVLDFGIAKLEAQGDAAVLTETGTVLGTPCYMAPEQASGEKDIDHRADIWSIGTVLYEALSGARCVEGDSPGQIVKRLLTQGITPISLVVPELPQDLVEVVSAMLRMQPEKRPADLREVHAALSRHTRVLTPSFGPPAPSEALGSAGIPSAPRPATPPYSVEPAATVESELQLSEPSDPRKAREETTLKEAGHPRARAATGASSVDTNGAHAVSVTPDRRSFRVLAALAAASVALGSWWLVKSSPSKGSHETPTNSALAASKPAPAPTSTVSGNVVTELPPPAAVATASASPTPVARSEAPAPLRRPSRAPAQRVFAAQTADSPRAKPSAQQSDRAEAPKARPAPSSGGLYEPVPF